VFVIVVLNVAQSVNLVRSTNDVHILEIRSQLLRALRAEKERSKGETLEFSDDAHGGRTSGGIYSEMVSSSSLGYRKRTTGSEKVAERGFFEAATHGDVTLCRMAPACVLEDAIIVPAWAKKHGELMQRCGFGSLEHANSPGEESSSELLGQDLLLSDETRLDFFDWTLTSALSVLDSWASAERQLLGPEPGLAKAPNASTLAVLARDGPETRAWQATLARRGIQGINVYTPPRNKVSGNIKCFMSAIATVPKYKEVNAALPRTGTSSAIEATATSSAQQAAGSPVNGEKSRDGDQLLEVYYVEDYPEKPVCRLHGACRTPEGALKLQEWLHPFSHLIAKCGFSNVHYTLSGEELSSARTIDVDLFGPVLPRDQNVNFASDFSPALHAHHVVRLGDALGTRRECITREGVGPCRENWPLYEPAIMIPSSHRGQSSEQSWIVAFASLYPGSSPRARLLSSEDFLPSRKSAVTKLRSVVGARRITAPRTLLDGGNAFFIENKFSRDVAFQNGKGPECKPNVLILENGKVAHKDLAELIKKLKLALEDDYGARISPKAVNLSKLKPLDQFRMVHDADVIITPSSQDLGNLLLARPKAVIIELQPFAYYVRVHLELARLVSAHLYGYSSLPDTKSFISCIQRLENSDVTSILKLWDEAIKVKTSESGEETTLRLDQASIGNRVVTSDERFCARNQHILINPFKLAMFARQLVDKVCRS